MNKWNLCSFLRRTISPFLFCSFTQRTNKNCSLFQMYALVSEKNHSKGWKRWIFFHALQNKLYCTNRIVCIWGLFWWDQSLIEVWSGLQFSRYYRKNVAKKLWFFMGFEGTDSFELWWFFSALMAYNLTGKVLNQLSCEINMMCKQKHHSSSML